MSRVALIVCGLALLAAVIVPLQSFYDREYDDSMQDAADRLSFIIDEFWASEADAMTVRGWEVLPSPDCFIEIEGHSLTIFSKNKTYRAAVMNDMDTVVIGSRDEVTIRKPLSEVEEADADENEM
jgi:hypothetical protein